MAWKQDAEEESVMEVDQVMKVACPGTRSEESLFSCRFSEFSSALRRDETPGLLYQFCQSVHKMKHTQKRGITSCIRVLDMLERMLHVNPDVPFVVCCCWGLKTVVVPLPQRDDAYIAICRSPVPDYIHLSYVNKALLGGSQNDQSVEDLKRDLWDPIPVFGSRLVEELLARMSAEGLHRHNSFEKQVEILRSLGAAYDHRYPNDIPAQDVVYYNVLGRKIDSSVQRWTLRMDVVVAITNSNREKGGEGPIPSERPHDTEATSTRCPKYIDDENRQSQSVLQAGEARATSSYVGRIIIRKSAPYLDVEEFPIVGMAFPEESSKKDCLRSPLFELMAKAIINGDIKTNCCEVSVDENDQFQDRVCLYVPNSEKALERRLDNPSQELALINQSRELALLSLHLANNSVRGFLIDKLRSSRDGFSEFCKWAYKFSNVEVYSNAGMGRRIVWQYVLEDILATISCLNQQVAPSILLEKWQVVNNILTVPGKYSPLAPAPSLEEEKRRQLRQLLSLDLLSGHKPRYPAALEKEIVTTAWESLGNDPGAFLEFLNEFPNEMTLALLEGARCRGIHPRAKTGRPLWREFVDFCRKQDHLDLFRMASEELYRIHLPRQYGIVRNMVTELLGLFGMGLTIGIVPWYKITDKLRGVSSGRYLAKELEVAVEAMSLDGVTVAGRTSNVEVAAACSDSLAEPGRYRQRSP